MKLSWILEKYEQIVSFKQITKKTQILIVL